MSALFDIASHRKMYEAIDVTYRKIFPHPTRNAPGFHDIVYVIEGRWDFRAGGEVHTVVPGDVFILSGLDSYEGVSDCTDPTRTIYLHCQVIPSDAESEQADAGDGAHCRVRLPYVIHAQGHQAIQDMFFEMTRLYVSDEEYRQPRMLAIWNALVCMLSSLSSLSGVRGADLVSRCREIMVKNTCVFHSESEMARMLYVSPKTLRAAFVGQYSKTFYKYQLDWKLGLAQSMIMHDPERKIYEISDELGFSDAFHMSRLFKKRFGISPSDFRRKFIR